MNVRCIFVGTWRATPNACNSGLVGGAPQIGVNACTSGLKTVSVQLAQQVCSWSITMESCCQQHIALQTGTTAHWGSRLADQFWKGPVGVTDPHLGIKAPILTWEGGGGRGRGYLGPDPCHGSTGRPRGWIILLGVFGLPLGNPMEVLFRILAINVLSFLHRPWTAASHCMQSIALLQSINSSIMPNMVIKACCLT